jgi:Tfp pilus assembly protein PilF
MVTSGGAWSQVLVPGLGNSIRFSDTSRIMDINAIQQTLDRAFKEEQAGRLQQAEALYRQVLSQKPDCDAAVVRLGLLAYQAGRFDVAVGCFGHALMLGQNAAGVLFHLGNSHGRLGRLDEAAAAYRRALDFDPNDLNVLNNLANIFSTVGALDEAIKYLERAVAVQPDLAWSHWNLASPLLLKGDYPRGFKEYEWRLKIPDLQLTPPDWKLPMWDGNDPAGKRMLIYAEQVFGDTISFVRFLPLLKERGARITLIVQEPILQLLRNAAGADAVISFIDPIPEADCFCPLPSLPMHLGTTIETAPDKVPYLQPDAKKVESWKSRLARETQLKVGLCWAGRPLPQGRSIPPQLLMPLAPAKGVRFISLQKLAPNEPPSQIPSQLNLLNFTNDLKDFSDTAALIANLDLVITIDTAIAHLAGALGKPVWVLLKAVPDFRWMMDRDQTPWYPTARLFHQQKLGEWAAPIDQAVAALHQRVAESR